MSNISLIGEKTFTLRYQRGSGLFAQLVSSASWQAGDAYYGNSSSVAGVHIPLWLAGWVSAAGNIW